MAFLPDPDLYPDPSGRAQRICKFIERLTLWEGDRAGQKFKLYDFQQAAIRRIYGPVLDSGLRQVRIACIWIPRGNAKTTLAAALGLAHFMGPEAEAGGQIVAAAADRENAGIAFNCAHQIVQQDDVLLERVRPIESRKLMVHPGTKSTFKAISTEAYSKHGLNVSFFLADELHAWPATEARKLWKVVTDSMVKRKQPLTVIISTAGEGQGGLAFDWWKYSWAVMKGEIDDPTFAPIIFAGSEKDAENWRSEEVWHKANPALKAGFLNIDELRTKVRRAEHFPTDRGDFLRFHLNIWTDGAIDPWVDMALYDRADKRRDEEDLLYQDCVVGVDLSSVEDLTCVAAVFASQAEGDDEAENLGYDVFAHFFLPEDNLAKKSDLDGAQYLRWADEGYLTITPGNRVSYPMVVDYVKDLNKKFNVLEVSIDRWNSTSVTTQLSEADFEVIEFGQGHISMAAPVKEIKRTILGGELRHGKNPILRMNFANVVAVKDDADNEKFTKAKSRGRIDGCVAVANAIGRILARLKPSEDKYRGIYSRPDDYRVAFGKDVKEQEAKKVQLDSEWDAQILKDMRHPEFQEHKARFERWQDRQHANEDEFSY